VLTKTGIHNIVFSGSWFLSFFQLLVTLLIFGVSICDENRPMEVSSKKPVSRYREVVHVPKKVISLSIENILNLLFLLPKFFYFGVVNRVCLFDSGGS